MTINTKTKSDIDNYELLQEKLDKYILDVDKHLVQWYQIKSKRPRRADIEVITAVLIIIPCFFCLRVTDVVNLNRNSAADRRKKGGVPV